MLEETRPAAEPASATGASRIAGTGSRSSRRKRGLLRRTGIVLPAAAIAAVAVAGVTIATYLVSPNGSGADSLAQAIDALPRNHSIALLEKERQQIIVMNEAATTMSTAANPVVVSPKKVQASEVSSGGDNSATSQDTSAPPPVSPGSAQAIAYGLLPAYGFSQATQWSCLEDLWQQESSWEYDAENASGAYGIPQSLPASKMASAGADYLTDPTTQIKWGLEYITQVYGTPCSAWGHEEADGWY
ncbi:MAG TPA: transglycosylase SLT domain-containing protein [Trebonia sp.]|jgi:soluble lytic murein transglycosylase-like protein|nr:transglycosylase SLT domain-containing protein [Trebonia sp.]